MPLTAVRLNVFKPLDVAAYHPLQLTFDYVISANYILNAANFAVCQVFYARGGLDLSFFQKYREHF